MPKYCSLDIETLASNSDAAIIQIGAVSFDPDAKNIFVPEAFEINVSFDPKLNSGFINGNTVQWWLQQSEEARKSVTKAPQVSESEALRSFRDWYILERCTEIWSHSTFDSVAPRAVCSFVLSCRPEEPQIPGIRCRVAYTPEHRDARLILCRWADFVEGV